MQIFSLLFLAKRFVGKQRLPIADLSLIAAALMESLAKKLSRIERSQMLSFVLTSKPQSPKSVSRTSSFVTFTQN
ncbi:hypothetical protein FJQ87_11000 [Shewanella sp. SNU WT4]|nr:hypothetical protein FJQ87_11000 [Shewanella sp. SNU WT4]